MNMFQMKEQDKTQEERKTNETQISNLPDKEFETMVIKILTELGKRRTQ